MEDKRSALDAPEGSMFPARLAFGDFELDTGRQELRRNGQLVALNTQPLKVLAFLALHADNVVTREALQQHVWGNVLVEYDQGINACVRQIRAALNDDPDEPRYIRTLRGTGYRFVAAVRRVGTSSTSRHRTWTRVAAASTLAVAATAGWVFLQPSDSTPLAVPTTRHTESESLRQQGLDQMRRAVHGPSLDSAFRLFSRASRLSYSSAPPVADLSMALAFSNRVSANDSVALLARRILGRAQALDPTGTETALGTGFADLFIHERPDSALLRFRRAVESDSTRMLSWLGLGLAWREQGEWARALVALSRAASLDTASELAGTELADALVHVRRFEDAHAVALRVTVAPASARLALLRANIAIARGNISAARMALESAAPVSRDSLLAHDPVLARIVGGSSPEGSRPSLGVLVADTLNEAGPLHEKLRRQIALAEGLMRAHRVNDALERLAWLLAVPSPVSLELVQRDPLWSAARETPRYAEIRRLWSR